MLCKPLNIHKLIYFEKSVNVKVYIAIISESVLNQYMN